MNKVVITGIGIITSLGVGVKDNWEAILSGKSGFKNISYPNISSKVEFVGGAIPAEILTGNSIPKVKRLDRSSKLLLIAVKEAIEQAELPRDKDISIVVGTTLGGMSSGENYHYELLRKKNNKSKASWLLDYLAYSQGINVVKSFFPSAKVLTISNACASGANAIGYGYYQIKYGQAKVVIVGGYDVLCPYILAGFSSLSLLAKGKCRPFDKERDGLLLGEGAGILILEDEGHARQRGKGQFLGEVIGYGEANDHYHVTQPDPSGAGAAKAMAKAIQEAGIRHTDIQYINAHGTGTPLNDKMEATAIHRVFGDYTQYLPVSSIKPMIGHTLGGAGAIEAIITLLALQNKTLPVNLNYDHPDPECPLAIVTETKYQEMLSIGMSTSFGFGGINAAVVLRARDNEFISRGKL